MFPVDRLIIRRFPLWSIARLTCDFVIISYPVTGDTFEELSKWKYLPIKNPPTRDAKIMV